METLLFYFGKQILCAGLFYGYYALTLRNQTAHQRSRRYLLLSVCLSIVLPLLPSIPQDWQWAQQTGITLPPAAMAVVQLPVIEVAQHTTHSFAGISFWQCYTFIVLLLGSRIVWNCWRIYRLVKQSEVTVMRDVYLVKNESIHMPFSFFHYIFWNDTTPTDNETSQQILQHELVHVHQQHTIDKLCMEVISSICWINPFFYWYKRELALVHEFLADTGAASDRATYAETILYAAFQPSFSLTNNFFHPPIHRRIKMLFLKPTKIPFMKKISLLPIAAIVIAVISCHQTDAHAAQNAVQVITQEEMNKIPADNIAQINIVARDTVKFKTKDSKTFMVVGYKQPAQPDSTPKKVFTIVENPPAFPGGADALNKYLSKTITYPKAARDKNIVGTVFVQFIIDTDGSISDVKIVGKPHAYLDEEALRVVGNMPNWKPGTQDKKPVAVQFNLPIRFILAT